MPAVLVTDCRLDFLAAAPAAADQQKPRIFLEFTYSPARVRRTRDGARFRIGRLTAMKSGIVDDLSHLVDRTYDYASPRELRWHLAERFGLAVEAVTLERH